MKTFILFLTLLSFNSTNAYLSTTMGGGCPSEFTEKDVFTPWYEGPSCLSREEVVENMVDYILNCGLLQVEEFQTNRENNENFNPRVHTHIVDETLAASGMFEYDQIYDRFLLSDQSSSADLAEVIERIMTVSNWDDDGTVLVTSSLYFGINDLRMGNMLAPSCEGRIYEVLID